VQGYLEGPDTQHREAYDSDAHDKATNYASFIFNNALPSNVSHNTFQRVCKQEYYFRKKYYKERVSAIGSIPRRRESLVKH
jgi:hypothetical protein